jgi:hypothetical protein
VTVTSHIAKTFRIDLRFPHNTVLRTHGFLTPHNCCLCLYFFVTHWLWIACCFSTLKFHSLYSVQTWQLPVRAWLLINVGFVYDRDIWNMSNGMLKHKPQSAGKNFHESNKHVSHVCLPLCMTTSVYCTLPTSLSWLAFAHVCLIAVICPCLSHGWHLPMSVSWLAFAHVCLMAGICPCMSHGWHLPMSVSWLAFAHVCLIPVTFNVNRPCF